MEIRKVYTSSNDERLYSVLLNEEEIKLFSSLEIKDFEVHLPSTRVVEPEKKVEKNILKKAVKLVKSNPKLALGSGAAALGLASAGVYANNKRKKNRKE